MACLLSEISSSTHALRQPYKGRYYDTIRIFNSLLLGSANSRNDLDNALNWLFRNGDYGSYASEHLIVSELLTS